MQCGADRLFDLIRVVEGLVFLRSARSCRTQDASAGAVSGKRQTAGDCVARTSELSLKWLTGAACMSWLVCCRQNAEARDKDQTQPAGLYHQHYRCHMALAFHWCSWNKTTPTGILGPRSSARYGVHGGGGRPGWMDASGARKRHRPPWK